MSLTIAHSASQEPQRHINFRVKYHNFMGVTDFYPFLLFNKILCILKDFVDILQFTVFTFRTCKFLDCAQFDLKPTQKQKSYKNLRLTFLARPF